MCLGGELRLGRKREEFRVEELAAQMGIGSKEVLFLLQSIGVDVPVPRRSITSRLRVRCSGPMSDR